MPKGIYPRKIIPKEIRFWRQVEKTETCWNWVGGHTTGGYGVMSNHETPGVPTYVHRFSYTLHKGIIPTSLFVLHSCDNRTCVNPDHLFLGTLIDNVQDMVSKKRHGFGEKSPVAKLKESDVLAIRKLFQLGIRQYKIAAIFSVEQSTVNAIVKKKLWKHI
jgi:hypothetical protein